MNLNQSYLIQTKELVQAWTMRIIRGRYQQSTLGWLWAIAQPVASVLILTIIFTRFVPIDTGTIPYPVFSYVAVVPWTFFANSLTDMTSSLISNMDLMTKIYFPREVLPISAMLARLMDFGIAYLILLVLMFIYRIPVNFSALMFLPLVLAIQIILITGLGLALSAANVFFRDVGSVLGLVMSLWFYASPIIYPITTIPEQYRSLYFLNPMAGILEAYRDILINGQIPGAYMIPAIVISLVLLAFGYWFFKRVEFLFADIV
ncbi:MAG: ABC transporter permease [Anaerolineales bacterium]|jgi:lipopolysaccharide transport system permease protein